MHKWFAYMLLRKKFFKRLYLGLWESTYISSLWLYPLTLFASVRWDLWAPLKVLPQPFSQMRFWLWPGHYNTLALLAFCCNFLLSLGSLSRCMIPFQPSFSCRTDGLRFDCKIFLHTEEFMLHGCKVHRPCGCKTNSNPYTPTTVLGSWYQVLVLTCCFFNKHLHLDWAINGHHLLFIIMPEHVVIVTCSCVMWLSPFMLDLSANSVSDSECFECFCTLNCRNAGVTLVHAGSDHSAADVRDRHQSAV